jgi:putative pyrimidine permease RutG
MRRRDFFAFLRSRKTLAAHAANGGADRRSAFARASIMLPGWKLKSGGVILPEERLPAGQTVVVGLQHVVAMFGATVLAPLLMGFDPNLVVMFSGVGTLIFFFAVGGHVPSYLGSSFSFIAAVIVATGYSGAGANPNIAIALGGIIAAGLLYTLIGIAVALAGHGWVERLMPPVVTGAVVAAIGLNLAPVAVRGISGGVFETAMAVVTVVVIGVVAVFAPGFWQRIPILLGGIFAYFAYWVLANGLGLGAPIEFRRLAEAAWFGAPSFFAPQFDLRATVLIAPIAIILVAENLGHLKALGALIGRNLDPYLGRAFIGDGIATMVAASAGGTGMTTYAENIGVMGMTKIYSTLAFVVAAAFAIVLGFSPKFGALILTIPRPLIGGLSVVVFGLIAAAAGRLWVENNVDFSKASNLITVGVSLVVGAGDLTFNLGAFGLGGIATASLTAIALNQLLRERSSAELGDKDIHTWATHSEIARAAGHSMAEEAAASIVHEVRQPLGAVIANANAALRWLESKPPDLVEARAALSAIVGIGHRANEVIEGIRAIFKRGNLQPAALDANKLMLGVLRVLGEELRAKQITVQTELVDDLPPILADRVQLQQVILNLIMNAIDAMSSVSDRALVLRVRSQIHEPLHVLLSVEDSGTGIDPKDAERIFDAFFTTKTRGMGMGLAICRSIVETHGGRLWAARADPHGSIFHIELPTA